MKRFFGLMVTCLLSGLAFSSAAKAETAEALHVDYFVICEDPAVIARITQRIESHLKKSPELVRDEKTPKRKLYLYAQKDENDRKNPNGWSFAIAHVSNVGNRVLNNRLEECQDPHCVEAKKVSSVLAKEEGFLKHLNVAHIDELTDSTLDQLVSTVFETFAKKSKGL